MHRPQPLGRCIFDGFLLLHPLRGAEAQKVDAGLQHTAREIHQRHITGLFVSIGFCQNPRLMVEFIGRAGQIIDIGADGIGGIVRICHVETVAQARQGQHQILGLLGFGRLHSLQRHGPRCTYGEWT